MRYTIKHVTRFSYDTPITESVMEARMQPRSDGVQRCLRFGLSTAPASRAMMYQDHDGNIVHHFNIPGRHARLTVTAEALVECDAPPVLPAAIGPDGWDRLDAMTATGEHWDSLAPSQFARRTPLLEALARELGVERGDDPLALLHRIVSGLYGALDYSPRSTRVDSPIDDALEARRGVCQDFAHVFIALVRPLGIPCRYVSGYLFHQDGRSDRSADGATHAWVEVLLPDLGWVGLDPTNDVAAGARHVRVAVGRDYADVPPTRGVYKGTSKVSSELAVSVQVGPVHAAEFGGDPLPLLPWTSQDAAAASPSVDDAAQQQQQ